MSRWSILLVAAAACGGSPKPAPAPSPLPGDTKPAETKPVEAAKTPAPAPAPAPPPAGPADIKLPAAKVAVKLVSPGKGKRTALRYTAKAGGKQQVELAMDFTEKHTAPAEAGGPGESTIPTIVLTGDAETKTVDKDGGAEYQMTVSGTDARDVPGASLPADKLKLALATLSGLTIGGSLSASGGAGEITLHLDKADDIAKQALDLIRLTLPGWPALPSEPVGVGAKWQATSTAKLADQIEVTQVTDYELVSHKGSTWTIKGTTKVTGTEQAVQGGKITGIGGTGTSEATLADGTLFPTYKSSIETSFTAGEGDKTIQFAIKVGGVVTPKK